MGEVVDLDAMRPHFSAYDPIAKQVHVIPVALVANIIDGKVPVSDADESMIRALLRMLLEEVADG